MYLSVCLSLIREKHPPWVGGKGVETEGVLSVLLPAEAQCRKQALAQSSQSVNRLRAHGAGTSQPIYLRSYSPHPRPRLPSPQIDLI